MKEALGSLVLAGVENFVFINAVLALAAFVVAAIAHSRARAWHPLSLSRLYAAAIIIPPVASAWLVSASLLPALWLGASGWLEEHQALHSLHLFNALTAPLNPVLGYAALGFVLMAAMAAVYAGVSAYFRIGRVVRQLDIGAEPASPEKVRQVEDTCGRYGINVGLVVSNYPFSFVWGYVSSKLVISTGLLNALSSEEMAALLEHEAAHHTRRDNLSKWALTICRYTSPVFPLIGLIYRWWNEQVEMICDEVAASRASVPIELANALVRLKRLTLETMPRGARTAESGFMGETGESFERRVTRILYIEEHPERKEALSLSRSWVKTAFLGGGMFAASLGVLFTASPLAIHRVIEAVLSAF